jgi:hypothetical protein
MAMFSNHLLVSPKSDGSFDDRDVKEALRAGRLYGSFDFMGYPKGFDYLARSGDTVVEMGGEVAVGATLEVAMPAIEKLDPAAEAPVLSMHLYRARAGGWDEVASGSEGKLTFTAAVPGAYRAEVRIIPKHLKGFAGRRLDLIRDERPWVYSNAIYVK